MIASSDVSRIGSVSISPDSKWVAFANQDRTLRSHVYIVPITGGEEKHLSDDNMMYSETNAVWTADGHYIVFTSAEGLSNGIASQGGLQTTMALWATSLRDQDRDPMNRDIDNEAQGLAAEAAARQQTGRGGGAGAAAVTVQIDWSGLARRTRQLTVPATAIGGLTASPDGHSVALTVATRGVGGGRGGAAADPNAGIYIINVESGQLTRVPPAHRRPRADADAAARVAAAASAAAAWCSRATAARSTSDRAAASTRRRCRTRRRRGGGGAAAGGGRGGGRGGAAATPEPATTNQTARQVTYTANLEVDHKALRAQVFNEGWRIMKNRFYDAKMHGADWNGAWETYGPLLDHLVDREELQTVMMMMIGQLNASHTGVSGGGSDTENAQQTRYPGFNLVPDASGFYKVGHVYKDGPADRDYLKIKEGHFVVVGGQPRSEERRQLLAVLHARARHEVPLPDQRQAREGRRLGRHDHADRQHGRPDVRQVGGRSPRDGDQAE